MPELKLARLPDRTPVKLAITVTPDLHQMLQRYAALYAEAYGREESVTELVPAMLATFLESAVCLLKCASLLKSKAR